MTYNVAFALRRWADTQPDTAALRFPSASYRTRRPQWDTWTYAELDRQSDAYARGFREAGIRAGDRTVLLIRPSLHFYAVVYGLFKLGAVPVLLDPGMGVRNVLACVKRTKPRAVIALPAVQAVAAIYQRPFASAEIRITDGSRWFWGGLTLAECHRPASEDLEIVPRKAHHDAAILFTSGSTGPPKGVASKQAMFAAQVEALQQMFGFTPGQSDHQAFAGFAIFDLSLGMTSILPKMDLSRPATARPADIVACLQTFEPEVAFASPIVWLNVSRYCLAEGLSLPSVRTLLTVGAPIPAYLHERFSRILADGAEVFTPYGATEAMPISWIGSREVLDETWPQTAQGAGTCVGRPSPGARIHIVQVTEDPIPSWSDDLAQPPGTIGEIVVGGDQVSPEYKDAHAANRASKIADGDDVLHRMGDLGYLDARGRLWFCGRKAHRLRTAAGMVPPVPVEGIYNEDEAVFRTALVGVGRPGAQVPVLCVEMEPGKRWGPEVEARLRAREAGTPYQGVVRRFLPHPGFPTDARHNSKIRREDLRPWAEKRCADLLAGAA